MTRLVRLRLVLVLAATVLAATAAITVPSGGRAASTSGDCIPGAGWGTLWPDVANQVLALTNAHRAQYGLAPLSLSQTLTDAAVWKALHMSRYSYMAHDDPAPPVARSSADRFEACGYPIAAASWGENIAYGYATAAAVVAAWLASPGHRANIEQPAFDEIGIAVATSPAGVHYWAQAFGSSDARNGGAPAPPPAPPVTTTPVATTPVATTPVRTTPVTTTPAPPRATTPTSPTPATPAPVTPANPAPAAPAAPAAPGAPPASGPSAAAAPTTTTTILEAIPSEPVTSITFNINSSIAVNPTLRISEVSTEPPQDGDSFGARLTVLSMPEGRRVTNGAVACRALIGSRTLPSLVRGFRRGQAQCTWRVPRGNVGRMLRTAVTVRAKSMRVVSRSVFVVSP